jgi:hypothetical protein
MESDELICFSTDYPHWDFDFALEALPADLSPSCRKRSSMTTHGPSTSPFPRARRLSPDGWAKAYSDETDHLRVVRAPPGEMRSARFGPMPIVVVCTEDGELTVCWRSACIWAGSCRRVSCSSPPTRHLRPLRRGDRPIHRQVPLARLRVRPAQRGDSVRRTLEAAELRSRRGQRADRRRDMRLACGPRGRVVDHTAWIRGPRVWTRALSADDLGDGGRHGGAADPRLPQRQCRCRHRERLQHAGGPLSLGPIENGVVKCPCHGSCFRLRDGAVVKGPASHSQPMLDVRIRDGWIEVRGCSRW